MEKTLQPKSLLLKDVKKGYTLDLDKALDPSTTISMAKAKLLKYGNRILRNTIRIDSGRLGIPVYMSLCGVEAETVIGTRKQMGKGGSPEQAEASALMELIERFSLFSFKRDPGNFLKGTFSELEKDCLPLDEITLSVGDLDAPGVILEAFKELPLRWTWAHFLIGERPILLPFDWFWAINEYNGSSAGNVMEEAILQGVCEVVERHVSAIISNEKRPVPLIGTKNLSDKKAGELLKKFENANIRLWISDFTLNTGIPTVGALAFDPSTYPHRSEIVWTAGTTTSPAKSLIRALTEVAQLAGDFDTPLKYIPSGLPKPLSLNEVEYITHTKEIREIGSLPDISDENIKVEIETALACLKRIGLNVYVIDVTHPELQIPACYTIVPGAQFRERTHGKMGRFLVRLIYETFEPKEAFHRIDLIAKELRGEHYIYFYMGEILRNLKRYAEAIKNYDLAIENAPIQFDQFLAMTYKSIALKEMGRYKESIESLQRALDLDSECPELYNLLGNCYYKLGDYESAINSFIKALELNPGSAIDYANIATNYLKMGKRDEAINYYKIALSIDPELEYVKIKMNEIMS